MMSVEDWKKWHKRMTVYGVNECPIVEGHKLPHSYAQTLLVQAWHRDAWIWVKEALVEMGFPNVKVVFSDKAGWNVRKDDPKAYRCLISTKSLTIDQYVY